METLPGVWPGSRIASGLPGRLRSLPVFHAWARVAGFAVRDPALMTWIIQRKTRGRQAQVADGLKDEGAVGGITAVNEYEASLVADHDPVGGWSFDEKDTGCLL